MQALDSADFVSLTIHKTNQGYQANVQSVPGGGWRVCIEPTPSAALAEVLRDPVPVTLAPPPY